MVAAVAALTAVFVTMAKASQERSAKKHNIPAFLKCANCTRENCPIPMIKSRMLLEQAGRFD